MCLEDVLIGRASWYRRIEVSLNTTTPAAASVIANSDRYALILPGDAAQVVYWDVVGESTVDEGLLINAGGAPLVITSKIHGALVGAPWHGRIAAGTATVSAFETVLPVGKLNQIREMINDNRDFSTWQ